MKYFPVSMISTILTGVAFLFASGIAHAIKDQPSLYYGVSITVEKDGQQLPVIDVEKNRFVIIQDGREKKISNKSPIQIQSNLKFDRRFITIEDNEAQLVSQYYIRLSNEYNDLLGLQMSSLTMDSSNQGQYDFEDRLVELEMEMADAQSHPDTVNVKVTYTPSWKHEKVFLLGLAHFTLDDGITVSKGVKGRLIDLPDMVPAKTETVSFAIKYLPENSKLSQVTYHFFSEGQEVPNNLSFNRRLLSEEETHQFFLLQYLSANAGKTRGPCLYEPVDRSALEHFLRSEEIENVILTVLIDEKGNTKDVIVKSGLTEFQKEVCDLARQAQFFPTLKDGEPIEQKVDIRLSQIIL